MEKEELLQQQLDAKNKELAEMSERHKELLELTTSLNDRVDSLSKIVSGRHAILDEANKSIAVATERNRTLVEAMRAAQALILDGDSEAARQKLAETLDTPPAEFSGRLPFLEESKKMRDAVMAAVQLLNQSMTPEG